MALHDKQRLRYPLGVVALVLSIVAIDAALEIVVGGVVDSGFPVWLPTFGTVGQTVVAYSMLANAYAHLLVPAAAFWLGIRYARTD